MQATMQNMGWRDFFRDVGQDAIRTGVDGVMVAQAGKHNLTPSSSSLHSLLPKEATHPVDFVSGRSMSALSFYRDNGTGGTSLNWPVVGAALVGVGLLFKVVTR